MKWMMTNLLVLFSNILMDVLAVLFINCVRDGYRIRATLTSMAIVFLSYISLLCIVQDISYMGSAIIGAGIGCYFMVGYKNGVK
jgi:hypothetical protein